VSLFVTGTDTGVGKTQIARLLIEALRNQGIDAVGYKPVACGDREDARILSEASGGLDLDLVNPVHLQSPVSPQVASMLENRTIDIQIMIDGFHALRRMHEVVIVEGAGGWEVPLVHGLRMSDLARHLALPVLVVVANRLGALNHAILTVDAVRAKELQCLGTVLNQLGDELDTAMITNKSVIAEVTGAPLIEHVIHGQDVLDETVLQSLGYAPRGLRAC
jgi:dethiobiotin synthetase